MPFPTRLDQGGVAGILVNIITKIWKGGGGAHSSRYTWGERGKDFLDTRDHSVQHPTCTSSVIGVPSVEGYFIDLTQNHVMVDVKPRDSRCHIHVKAIIDLGHNVGDDEMMGQAGRPLISPIPCSTCSIYLLYPALPCLGLFCLSFLEFNVKEIMY